MRRISGTEELRASGGGSRARPPESPHGKSEKEGKREEKKANRKRNEAKGKKKKPAGGAGSRRCSSGRAEPEERSAAGSSGSSVRLKSPRKRRLPALRLRVRILSSASRRRQHRPASGCGAEAALSPEFSAPAQRGPSSVWPQGWRRVRTPHSVPDRPNSGSGAPGPDAALRRRCSAPGSRWVPSSAPRFLPFLHSSIGVEPKSCLFQVQIPAHFSTLHKAAFPNLSVPRIPRSPTPAFLELGVPQTRRSHAQLPQFRLSLHSAFPKSDALQTRFPTPNLFHPISASFTPGLSWSGAARTHPCPAERIGAAAGGFPSPRRGRGGSGRRRLGVERSGAERRGGRSRAPEESDPPGAGGRLARRSTRCLPQTLLAPSVRVGPGTEPVLPPPRSRELGRGDPRPPAPGRRRLLPRLGAGVSPRSAR